MGWPTLSPWSDAVILQEHRLWAPNQTCRVGDFASGPSRCCQHICYDAPGFSLQMDQHAANCGKFITRPRSQVAIKSRFNCSVPPRQLANAQYSLCMIARGGKCASGVRCGGAATLINKYVIIFMIVGAAAAVQSLAF